MSDSTWMPIESAPKDGTKILLVCMDAKSSDTQHRVGTMAVDFWHDGTKHGFVGWGKFNSRYWPATHWMPLPSLPAHTPSIEQASS